MTKFSAIINKGINAMGPVFTSCELLIWIRKHYPGRFEAEYKKYISNNKTEKDFYNFLYNTVRKSCKVIKISVLEMPEKRNSFIINYVMTKKDKYSD